MNISGKRLSGCGGKTDIATTEYICEKCNLVRKSFFYLNKEGIHVDEHKYFKDGKKVG